MAYASLLNVTLRALRDAGCPLRTFPPSRTRVPVAPCPPHPLAMHECGHLLHVVWFCPNFSAENIGNLHPALLIFPKFSLGFCSAFCF